MSDQANVCVIDDDKEVLDITCQLLELGGFHARGYERVQDFLEEYNDVAIECVVTDLRMPNIDGAELQRRLRATGSLVSLIVLTGYASADCTQQLQEDKAVTLLEKPYDPDLFLEVVGQAIEQTRQRRTLHEPHLAASHQPR
jgi:two-component system response regulator FixJ